MAEDKKAKLVEKQTKDAVDKDKKVPADKEQTGKKEEKMFTLVLKGAGSLASGGMKFVKDMPQKVENPELAERLLASELFKAVGDKK